MSDQGPARRLAPLEGGGEAPDLVQLLSQQPDLDLNKFTLFLECV